MRVVDVTSLCNEFGLMRSLSTQTSEASVGRAHSSSTEAQLIGVAVTRRPYDDEKKVEEWVSEERLREVTDIKKALRQLQEMEKESAERHERFKRESAERGAEIDRKLEKLKKLSDSRERRLHVNKRTHRVRFISETEDEVTIVVEKKGSKK